VAAAVGVARKARDGRWALERDAVAQALAQRGERLRVVVFLSAGAVVAAAVAMETEEGEARTADVVAHGARVARDAGETEGAGRQTASARARAPGTREAEGPSCPQANSADAAPSHHSLSSQQKRGGAVPRVPWGTANPEAGLGGRRAAKSGCTAPSAPVP